MLKILYLYFLFQSNIFMLKIDFLLKQILTEIDKGKYVKR